MRLTYALLIAATVSASTSTVSTADVTGQASVIDGNTLEIHGARIRLWGIDAPETDQLCRKEGSDQYRSAHAVLFLSAPSSDYFVEGLIGTQGDTVPIAKQLKIELQSSRVVIFQK
jgi:hypothetical protein